MHARFFVNAVLLTAIPLALAQSTPSPSVAKSKAVIAFTHGLWFDGAAFQLRTVLSVDGVLADQTTQSVSQTIDLHGGFVIPPFGDAHEHMFSSVATVSNETAMFLRDGIFYAQGVTEPISGSAKVRPFVNRPDGVDVTYAHGGLTGDQGHPKEVYEGLALGTFYKPGDHTAQLRASPLREGDAYWVIDTLEQLAERWPKILAGHPDLIKVYLTNSEHDAASRMQADKIGIVGLHPAMVAPIVERAHAAHLKVIAHVDTAADFHAALAAGVDEMAHLPGYCAKAIDDPKVYRLTMDDVSLAGRRHLRVIATASLCDNSYWPAADKAATRAGQIDNLRRLRAAGVVILVGSDSYGSDTVHEMAYLSGLGLWSNAELLRMATEQTDHDIFPARHIGTLTTGSETSFLVLHSNPLDRWSATSEIEARWKDGRPLQVPLSPGKPQTP